MIPAYVVSVYLMGNIAKSTLRKIRNVSSKLNFKFKIETTIANLDKDNIL